MRPGPVKNKIKIKHQAQAYQLTYRDRENQMIFFPGSITEVAYLCPREKLLTAWAKGGNRNWQEESNRYRYLGYGNS